jgi:hypothetical protein
MVRVYTTIYVECVEEMALLAEVVLTRQLVIMTQMLQMKMVLVTKTINVECVEVMTRLVVVVHTRLPAIMIHQLF